jgi:hypothetical protein
MGFFLIQDIETDDAGEIQVANGDLKLASRRRTAIQMFNWLMLTNHAEYAPDPLVCANLGEFIGAPNIRRTHNLMRQNAMEGIRLQQVFFPHDIQLEIEPIDSDAAGVVAKLNLSFDEASDPIVLAYQFPYPDGEITALEY